ncbi:MAG: arginase [Rickettsiaceae bacterium]|jgi:arginase|nr:arginase [Rickettsiaceae bacterium]
MPITTLIGYASGYGAQIQSCKDASYSLQRAGLAEYLNHFKIKAQWADIYNSPLENTNANNLALVADYCTNLRNQVTQTVDKGEFPVTLGGDHTMAIGTWTGVTNALSAQGKFGLIWLDAHMDSHTSDTSLSGAYHGMPLACLMGHGLDELRSNPAALNPKHICLVGIRSFESGEAALLQRLGVRIFFMEEIRQRGLPAILKDALAIVKSGTKGYGLSIDLDVFDPKYAPATGSLADNGLSPEEVFPTLHIFAGDNQLKALEIAEYNPNLDKNSQTENLVKQLITSILSSVNN